MHSLDESEEDDSLHNIVVPLVAASSNDTPDESISSTAVGGADSALRKRRAQRNKQRLHSLEIAMRAQEEEESSTTTCLGDSWRFVASVLLASVMVAPLLLKHYRSSSLSSLWPSDGLPCAQDLQISYSNTWKTMSQAATDYCIESRPSCDCKSPFVPQAAVSESQLTSWNVAFQRNVNLVQNASTADEPNVVLLGDSITEHWQGTSMGRMKYPDIHNVYQSLFRDKRKNGITGLALGISGDRCPQVLYRLQNGEMPTSLGSPVWWLLIGTNDLSNGCTPESVLIGIINLVQEISNHYPTTTVVVNSILPRPGDESGKLFGNLWNGIVWINERLECYAQGVDRVGFYNATRLFLKNDDPQCINETLMPDMLHPSAEGSRVWGTEIVKRVKELVKK